MRLQKIFKREITGRMKGREFYFYFYQRNLDSYEKLPKL